MRVNFLQPLSHKCLMLKNSMTKHTRCLNEMDMFGYKKMEGVLDLTFHYKPAFCVERDIKSLVLSTHQETMRGASGLFHPLHALKSFFWGKCSKEDQNLEKRLIEAIKQRNKSTGQKTFRSMNSITMRFPQLKEGLRNIKHLFNQYDEDANGTIDHQEMKKCFEKMQIQLSDKDMHSLYRYCDVDGNKGIQYPEFIVLLCLAYLLTTSAVNSIAVLGSEQLRYIFNELFDAFLFLDKDGDGKLKRKDMVLSLNDSYHQEKSPGHVTSRRFSIVALPLNSFFFSI